MIDGALVKRILTIRSVPPTILVLTALASYVGQISAILQGWPLWAIGLATILPWIPLFASEMVWTYRHYQWLALFYILVITQGGHVVEHIVQMIQIHLLDLSGAGDEIRPQKMSERGRIQRVGLDPRRGNGPRLPWMGEDELAVGEHVRHVHPVPGGFDHDLRHGIEPIEIGAQRCRLSSDARPVEDLSLSVHPYYETIPLVQVDTDKFGHCGTSCVYGSWAL